MTKRPNVFDQEGFQASLRHQGCPESFISPITSDFRLFVPLVIRHLGDNGMFEIVENARAELNLGPQESVWRVACKYIAGWAEEQVDQYKTQK